MDGILVFQISNFAANFFDSYARVKIHVYTTVVKILRNKDWIQILPYYGTDEHIETIVSWLLYILQDNITSMAQ